MVSPNHPDYKPFFFDRKGEYGSGHTYWEALCHASPSRDIKMTSSARYFNNRDNKAILTQHPPGTIHINAFIESVRKINANLLSSLKETLTTLANSDPENIIPESLVQEFIDGVFRNIAIQVHFSNASYNREFLYHMDHVFSVLHMAITLNGQRIVGFRVGNDPLDSVKQYTELAIRMQPGDVYITTPAGIMHGISMDELNIADRSVAIQCRTLLGSEASIAWSKRVPELCVEITKLLDKYPLRMPTYLEWDLEFKKMQSDLVIPTDKMIVFSQGDMFN